MKTKFQILSDGQRVVRGPASELIPDAVLEVATWLGELQQIKVSKILQSFPVQDGPKTRLASIAQFTFLKRLKANVF